MSGAAGSGFQNADALKARLRELEDECSRLEDINRQLRRELKWSEPVPFGLRLTPSERSIMAVLMARDVARRDSLVTALYSMRTAEKDVPSEKVIDVMLHNIRRKLKPYGIVIIKIFGTGWRLAPEGRAVITRMLAEENGAGAA